jgi:hypothetical protein
MVDWWWLLAAAWGGWLLGVITLALVEGLSLREWRVRRPPRCVTTPREELR